MNMKPRATQRVVRFDIQIVNVLHVEFFIRMNLPVTDSLHLLADVCAWPSNLCGEGNSRQSPPDACWRQCPIKVQSSANKRVALTGNSNSHFNSDQASGNGKNKNTSIIVTGSFKSHGEQLPPRDVCLPALLRSLVFWCDQSFTPKCYRLTSLHNCMLSLYKGKENDIVLKGHHYYICIKNHQLDCKGLECKEKKKVVLCTEGRSAVRPLGPTIGGGCGWKSSLINTGDWHLILSHDKS